MSAPSPVPVFLVAICCLTLICAPAVAQYTVSDLSGSIVRGHQFTVDITGKPNTSYYVWLTGTWPLTGEAYDQPPIVVPNQWNVEQDPEGGPYTIGSYQYNNGGGRTIIDDVAPSSSLLSDTNYYALVTTDEKGLATVAFGTSLNTALRSYSVRVENPTLVNTETLLVERGDTKVTQGSISISAATRPTREVTTVTTVTSAPTSLETTPATTPPVTIPATAVPVTTASPTPSLPAADAALCILAVGAGLGIARMR